MTEQIAVALIGVAGSCIGSLIGVICASKLTEYRLTRLEEKVDKQSALLERIYVIEKEQAVIKTNQSNDSKRIARLESVNGRKEICSQN